MNAHTALDVPRRLWLRIEDFVLLNDAGALENFSKSELIDGEIITINAQYRPHSAVHSELLFRLKSAFRNFDLGLTPLVEAAVAMPPHDMPEPDIVVTSEPRGEGPVPLASVALIVEIASTTRQFHLGRKAALYARHHVPEYWVVDLDRAKIVRHWQPGVQGYEAIDTLPLGSPVTAATLPALAVPTADLV